MILMIDNYDSFVYNLVQYIGELGEEVLVKRNDEITIEEIKELDPEIIVLSPGPCSPKESGICIDVVNNFKGIKPILGICLGTWNLFRSSNNRSCIWRKCYKSKSTCTWKSSQYKTYK